MGLHDRERDRQAHTGVTGTENGEAWCEQHGPSPMVPSRSKLRYAAEDRKGRKKGVWKMAVHECDGTNCDAQVIHGFCSQGCE